MKRALILLAVVLGFVAYVRASDVTVPVIKPFDWERISKFEENVAANGAMPDVTWRWETNYGYRIVQARERSFKPAPVDVIVTCLGHCDDVGEYRLFGQTVTPASTITINATVVTIGAVGGQINVRQAPSAGGNTPAIIGTIPVGTTGTVIAGPITSSSATVWWEVKFSVCTGNAALLAVNCTGWVGGDQLQTTTSSPPVQPASPPVVSVSCTPKFAPVSMATFVPSGAKGTSFTIANNGPGTLTLTSATTALPFTVTAVDKFPITLSVGQSETFTATFLPTVKGTFVTNVNIFSSNSTTAPAITFGVTGVSQ